MDVQMWKAILEIVKSLSDLLLRCLPDFWKLSKSFMDGKFQKVRYYYNIFFLQFD